MGRLDGRSVDQFKSHIKFTTEIESRLMECWSLSKNSGCMAYADNGIDNNGSYVDDSVNTSAVDFVVTTKDGEEKVELKFVPTAGKLTLKLYDLNNYIDQEASVLFIFNFGTTTLKVPADLDMDSHWKKIEQSLNSGDLKWALVGHETLKQMLYSSKLQIIPYMGRKPGIIVTQDRFSEFFTTMDFEYDN